MTVKRTCQFELFLVNNEEYTDYDVGKRLSPEPQYPQIDCYDDAMEVIDEIAKELLSDFSGQQRLAIEVEPSYSWNGSFYEEPDYNYSYSVVSREDSRHFDDLATELEA